MLATNVSAAFGDGTTNFVTLSGGSGFFVIKPGGMAGDLGGTVAVTIPGVELSGTFRLALNTTGTAVIETIAFGPAPGTVTAVVLGDVNGDGRADLISGTNSGGLLATMNDGSGTPFDALPAVRFGNLTDNVTSLALGDVDGDGDLDLVAGTAGAASRLYRNDGSGGFSAPTDLDAATAVALGDLNGDGKLDLVLGAATGTSWLAGSGTGTFATPTSISAVAADAVAVGDLDGDGKLDVVIAGDGAYRNLGTGTFAAVVALATGTGTALALADLDGDGKLDVIAGTQRFTNTSTSGALSFGAAATFSPAHRHGHRRRAP